MKHIILILCLLIVNLSASGKDYEADVCVYGGTASGITAALAAKSRGMSVIIVEPMKNLGGVAGGGISISWDCLFLDDIGGIARELRDADSLHQWEVRTMLKKKVEQAGIKYFTEFRLDGKDDVVVNGSTIEKIYLNHAPIMDEGVPPPEPDSKHALSVRAKVFIDSSYEADLMAFSGVDYTVGREARSKYNESLAGQRTLQVFDVDPYVEEGNPESGLLPMISTEPYVEGGASRYFTAYNFRLLGIGRGKQAYFHSFVKNHERVPMKPLGRPVNREKYALVIRALKDNPKTISWPHYNYDRHRMLSSSIPGRQADYPDGSWPARSKYWRELIDHIKTMNQLTNNGDQALLKGYYPTNGDFPDQLYIRLGRRMISDYVMTQHNLMYQTTIEDSIGLAYYAVDIYPTRLIAHKGKVASEGQTFVRVSPGPYPISYRSLVPKKEQVDNLIVSVCMSASHVAMASIRMESGYVVMGEAAGILEV